jgi:hypothetical protein
VDATSVVALATSSLAGRRGPAGPRRRFTARARRVYDAAVSERYRPSLRHSLENWRTWQGPFLEKLRLTARNEWRKIRRLRSCCDHIDEPGC